MHHIREGTDRMSAAGSRAPLRWPAPGLESIHGAAWPPVTLLAIGAALLTVSLLASVVTPQPFWSTGPFGTHWWAPLLASLLGLGLVVRAMERLARLLLASARAARLGYGWSMIAWTATDQSRDSGFLLQGLRHYSTLGGRERLWLLNARVVAAVTYCVALLWVPASLSAGMLAAGRGHLSGTGPLLLTVLAPAAVLLAVGLCCRLLDGLATGRARKGWLRAGAAAEDVADEATAWRTDLDERLAASPSAAATRQATAGPAVGAGPVRGLGWAMALLAVLLPLPLLTVATASAVGPLLSQAMTGVGSSATRMARVAVLQPYALPADPSITAEQAGDALNSLMFAGTPGLPSSPLQRAPVRVHTEPVLPADAPPMLAAAPERIIPLFERLDRLTSAEVRYLEHGASHPVLAEVRLLARAAEADIGGGRWHDEQARHAAFFELPTARPGIARSVAAAHIGDAVLLAARGDLSAAELRLREVVSVGLLVAREGPTTIDVLVGTILAEQGGAALQAFYEATGQQRRAEAIRIARDGVDALDRATKALRSAAWDVQPRDLMASVENELLPRGMRWERLMNLQSVSGCLNPHSAVFGAGTEYTAWLERVRGSLVRYPSDEALFAAAMNGMGTDASRRTRSDAVRRVVGLTLRGESGSGSCASVLGAIAGLN
jgi:hypothetical protein